MRRGLAVLLAVLLLTGADPAPLEPPGAVPPEAPPAEPAPAADPATGPEALAEVVRLIGAGEYESALGLALLGVSQYPDLASSFRAAAELATDQLDRRSSPQAVVPPVYDPSYRYGRPPRPKVERPLRAGFDLGLPSGIRGEIVTGGRTVDSVGLRFGGNVWWYGLSSLVAGWEGALYVDWSVTDTWQLETPIGFITYSSTPYAMIGLSVQYDPPSPLQVNLGAKVTTYGIAPDFQVGFVW